MTAFADPTNPGPHSTPFHNSIATQHRIYLAEVGSRVTGVPRKNDHDLTGVCIEPPEVITGITEHGQPLFEQYQNEYRRNPELPHAQEGDFDISVFGLRKFVRMAAAGAPTALIPLWVPQNAVQVSTPFGAKLRANRSLLLSRQAGMRFAGMANRNREKVQRVQRVDPSDYERDHAYHGLRALMFGIHLMDWHDMAIPLPDFQLAHLARVRGGESTYGQVTKDFTDLGQRLADKIGASRLPEHPDYDQINVFLAEMYTDYWNELLG